MPTILIADDDHMIRYTLQEICSYAGYVSHAAENGIQATQIFLREKIDLILVDYYMPELDGLETIKALRNVNAEVPIIVLTVDERDETVQSFFAAGATDFALKPVRAPDLLSRIQLNLQLSQMKQLQEARRKEIFVTKGISGNTLDLIVNLLKEKSEPVTIEVITDSVGLAYATVHRYITHLIEEGLIEVISDYRKVGRPKNRYRWLKK